MVIEVLIYDVVSRCEVQRFYVDFSKQPYPGKKATERACLRIYKKHWRPKFEVFARCKF